MKVNVPISVHASIWLYLCSFRLVSRVKQDHVCYLFNIRFTYRFYVMEHFLFQFFYTTFDSASRKTFISNRDIYLKSDFKFIRCQCWLALWNIKFLPCVMKGKNWKWMEYFKKKLNQFVVNCYKPWGGSDFLSSIRRFNWQQKRKQIMRNDSLISRVIVCIHF